jgi:hypothetical protein
MMLDANCSQGRAGESSSSVVMPGTGKTPAVARLANHRAPRHMSNIDSRTSRTHAPVAAAANTSMRHPREFHCSVTRIWCLSSCSMVAMVLRHTWLGVVDPAVLANDWSVLLDSSARQARAETTTLRARSSFLSSPTHTVHDCQSPALVQLFTRT